MKCLLFGVSEESKSYRLYNLITQKIIISHDVVFDEDGSWDWNNTINEPISVNLYANDENKTKPKAQSSRDTLSVIPANEPIDVNRPG